MILANQVKAARRELAKRKYFYPKWIASGKLKADDARHEIEAMEAIVGTLEKLADEEAKAKSPELPL